MQVVERFCSFVSNDWIVEIDQTPVVLLVAVLGSPVCWWTNWKNSYLFKVNSAI